jgi:hypothetical protein
MKEKTAPVMSTKRLIFLLAALMLWIQHSEGQNTSIGISAFLWNGPQVANYNDTTFYSYSVKNYGPGTISTPVTIYTGVMDSTNNIDTIRIDNTSLVQVFLNPGDSVWVNDMQVFDQQNFRVGATVVVIWPSTANATLQSSASYTIIIDTTMNIIEVTPPSKGYAYPNPARDKVTISPPGDENSSPVEQVRIFDEAGRLVLARSGTGTLDISHLPRGSYLIEVIQSNDTRSVYKIVKQEP